jgi:hypothetical protein
MATRTRYNNLGDPMGTYDDDYQNEDGSYKSANPPQPSAEILATEQQKKLQDFVNQNGASIYGTPDASAGEMAGRQNAQNYYGTQYQLGQDAADFRARTKENLNKPSGIANRITNMANQDIARANRKSGMSGVNNAPASIKAKRDAIVQSENAQQTQNQIALSNYGKSISAGISGTESMAAAGSGKAIAAQPGQTPSYGGGMFGSIICSELFRQRKISAQEVRLCHEFGASISEETFYGYLTIARPIVKLMKRSDKFSNLFIGWAKSISKGEPNAITRFMLPICTVIGKLRVKRFAHAR